MCSPDSRNDDHDAPVPAGRLYHPNALLGLLLLFDLLVLPMANWAWTPLTVVTVPLAAIVAVVLVASTVGWLLAWRSHNFASSNGTICHDIRFGRWQLLILVVLVAVVISFALPVWHVSGSPEHGRPIWEPQYID
ncbi:MAG: hypothetical protein ABFC96_16600 [Thermoguttaceae bacterium]